MIRWTVERVSEDGRTWRDRVSDCGRYRIEAGHCAAGDARPWALHVGGRWVSDHRTLADAQRAAERDVTPQNHPG